MCEDRGLATRTRHHKLKIAFFFSAMRHHAAALREAGWEVDYRAIDDPGSHEPFEEKLLQFMLSRGADTLRTFEIEDKFFEKRLEVFAQKNGFQLEIRQSPMFLTSRADFAQFDVGGKKRIMKDFYAHQRRRLGILMESDGQPTGGRWSFDTENRERLPKGHPAKSLLRTTPSPETNAVCAMVETLFPDHPGQTREFWMPVTRAGWIAWLDDFIEERLNEFGPYEDALSLEDELVNHSALSPALNTGLLTPQEVVQGERYEIKLCFC
jgi:deoxyribodipyrimidine photolyase-related protein